MSLSLVSSAEGEETSTKAVRAEDQVPLTPLHSEKKFLQEGCRASGGTFLRLCGSLEKSALLLRLCKYHKAFASDKINDKNLATWARFSPGKRL